MARPGVGRLVVDAVSVELGEGARPAYTDDVNFFVEA
jgi:hypothetical protein